MQGHNEHDLNSYLLESVNYIEKWRTAMDSASGGIDGMPGEKGFKSKPPFNLDSMDAGDMGLVALARLAICAINRDLIPDVPMGGVAWARGKPIGVKPVDDRAAFDLNGNSTGIDPYAPIRQWVDHLRVYAPTLLRDERVTPYVEDVARWVRMSRSKLNKPEDVWLTRAQVMEKFGVAEGTVTNWGKHRAVRVLDGYGERLYHEHDVKFYMEASKESKYQANRKNVQRALKARGIGVSAGGNTRVH